MDWFDALMLCLKGPPLVSVYPFMGTSCPVIVLRFSSGYVIIPSFVRVGPAGVALMSKRAKRVRGENFGMTKEEFNRFEDLATIRLNRGKGGEKRRGRWRSGEVRQRS